MKNYYLKNVASLLALVLFLFSCGEKEKEEVIPAALSCKISSMAIILDGSGINFTYDAQDRITRLDPTTGSSGEYITLESNSAGQVVKVNSFESGAILGSYSTYEYNPDGTVLVIKDYEKNNSTNFTLYSYSAFEYNGAKQVSKSSFYINLPTTSPWIYSTYTYNTVGNVSEIKTYNKAGTGYALGETTTLVYDDKKNPFYRMYFFSPMGGPEVYSPNNITESKIVYPGVTTADITKYTYEYDAQGQETKQTYENQGNIIPFLKYSYDCK